MTAPTRLIIAGPRGRMGQALLQMTRDSPGVEAAAVIDRPGAPAGTLRTAAALAELTDLAGAVLVDFTSPARTRELLAQLESSPRPAVIGTTGLTPEDHARMRVLAGAAPILYSANFSLGIALLADAVQRLAGILPQYDIEIIEMHHRHKADAPSGTAILLGDAAAQGRHSQLDLLTAHGRTGDTGERPAGQIGFHAVRGGDIVGEHTVLFAGHGERLELTHRASSRMTFAAGAVAAARFLAERPPGFYTLHDVLGLGAAGP